MKIKQITIGLVVLAVLGFGYYAISPLFIHVKVNEALPQGEIPSERDQQDKTVTQGEQRKLISSNVVGTTGHPASGTARIIETVSTKYVRYENFKTINGPDIYVYLSKDLNAQEFISLGKVKATEGNLNYEIPAGTDLSQYHYVLTWCKQFGVLFNSADLSQ